MPQAEKTLFVYENWRSETPSLIGRLNTSFIRGQETFSFEYTAEWLNSSKSPYTLDPDLSLYSGRQYPPIDKHLFGLFTDSCPDRWGRLLMKRKEAIDARKEDRKPRKLTESDFLLGVYDESRMGALRFSLKEGGEFLSNKKDFTSPPWIKLRALENASIAFENDECNSGAWEKVVHDLARLCSLHVPESTLETLSKSGSTFIVKRFDRDGKKRIHFASAMTLIGKTDGASAADGTSYLDLAAYIRANGAEPKQDLMELWKRIVFNMAVSNTDDHLRNHGFILMPTGWRLSPLFDVNPIPSGDRLALNVSEYDNRIDLSLAIEVAEYFGLTKDESTKISADICETVKNNWVRIAEIYGLSRDAVEYMRPAFSTL